MHTLVLDTSAGSRVAVVARAGGQARILARHTVADPRRHAEALAPLVQASMRDAALSGPQLKQVVVGTGPAPFTGLRAGIITARALARGWGVPVLGISALDALARAVFDQDAGLTSAIIVTDARRREVYAGHFAPRGTEDVRVLAGPVVSDPAGVRATLALGEDDPAGFHGAGTTLYPEHLPAADVRVEEVDLSAMARLAWERGAAGGARETEPLYLRRPDIHPGKAAQ